MRAVKGLKKQNGDGGILGEPVQCIFVIPETLEEMAKMTVYRGSVGNRDYNFIWESCEANIQIGDVKIEQMATLYRLPIDYKDPVEAVKRSLQKCEKNSPFIYDLPDNARILSIRPTLSTIIDPRNLLG